MKFLKTKIKNEKEVLGVLVGLNFLKEHEVFEKKHLLNALSLFFPDVYPIKESFFVDKGGDNSAQIVYLEVAKKSGNNFTFDEISRLKRELPGEVKAHIEQLMHRVFMPRNEEEIARNILVLSKQLKFVNDIPQVIVNFDEQNYKELAFTVILLRVLKPSMPTIQEMFKQGKMDLRIAVDRVKRVGILRRKYLKEANVFKIFLPGQDYVRKDHSVDLNKARIDVINNLNKVFTEVRDYNGGMIFKQNEALNGLKNSLGRGLEQNEFLLEKFFYAIRPVEMSIIASVFSLKCMFLMLVNAIKREETRIKKYNDYLFKKESKAVYTVIPVYDNSRKRHLKETISKYYLLSSDFISFDVKINEIGYLGYIFNCDDEQRQRNFLKIIQQALDIEIKRG